MKYKEPTYAEIADNWELWSEYVDYHATMSESEFDAMAHDQRIETIFSCFGEEEKD